MIQDFITVTCVSPLRVRVRSGRIRTGRSITVGISTANRLLQRITNGLQVAAPVLIQTLFTYGQSRMAPLPFYRPRPESLKPPKGAMTLRILPPAGCASCCSHPRTRSVRQTSLCRIARVSPVHHPASAWPHPFWRCRCSPALSRAAVFHSSVCRPFLHFFCVAQTIYCIYN